MLSKKTLAVATLLLAAAGAQAQEQVLNLYSARHYSTDEALYNNFTKATGIKIYRVDVDGLFKPVKSQLLDDAIPAQYRAPATAEGSTWYGFSTRARVIAYDKARVKREDVDTYEELADPKNKGKVCLRSGSHPYNLSLFGAVTEHMGEQKAEAWLKGIVDNMARAPQGGDTDQLKAV